MDSSSDLDAHEADLCGLPRRADSAGRDRLEEIASAFLDELRAGGAPDIEAVVAREPKLAEQIREFLPLVAAMEDWKAHQQVKTSRAALPEQFSVKQLGDCRIVREIARGGMGIVFEAEQGSVGRRVAVKLLPRRFSTSESWAEQFLREARIAAGLQHAHIVPVFSFGEEDDSYFYVMQFVEGVGLDKLIAAWRAHAGIVFMDDLVAEVHPHLAPREADLKRTRRFLRQDSWSQLGKIAAQVVSALRHAHQQGTLHRDIKPANLLIDRQGKLWITDFGLAVGREHLLDDQPERLAGTFRYMAPEQFRGQGDERSDIYSFGATLYELCTLQPAFPGADRRVLLQQIESGRFTRPRKLQPQLPPQLERVILKCLATKPEQRYQSADELHAALLRMLNAERPRRAWRGWFRR